MEQNYVGPTRQTNIDFIRIVSLLLVMISHYGLESLSFLDGTQGVVLFFFISGYCIAMTSEKKRNFWDFWRARLKRLLPTLVFGSLFIYLVKQALFSFSTLRFTTLYDLFMTLFSLPLLDIPMIVVTYVTGRPDYLFVDGAIWSLLVEFRFYFLFGLFYFLGLRHWAILPVVLSSLIAIWTYQYFGSRINDFFMYLIFFGFGAGYYYYHTKKASDIGMATMILAALLFLLMSFLGIGHISMRLGSLRAFVVYAPLFFVFILLMKYVRVDNPKLTKPLFYLALLTYPAYIIHQDIGLILINIYERNIGESPAALRSLLIPFMFLMAHFITVLSDKVMNFIQQKTSSYKPVRK